MITLSVESADFSKSVSLQLRALNPNASLE